MAIYRLHDTTGDDLGLLEHPAPDLEPGDVVVVADGREAIVTARVEAEPGWGQLVALLEAAIAPTPLTSDDSIAVVGHSRAICGSRSATWGRRTELQLRQGSSDLSAELQRQRP